VPHVPAAPPSRARFETPAGVVATVLGRGDAALVALHGRIDTGPAEPGLLALATELLARPPAGEPDDAPPLRFHLHEAGDEAGDVEAIDLDAAALPDALGPLLDGLARRLLRPVPEGDAFEALRDRARRRAEAAAATPRARLWARARAELFPAGSAFAQPPWSDPETLGRLSPEDLRRFFRVSVSPPRLRLAVVGATPDAVRAALDRSFPGRAVAAPAAPPRAPAGRGARAWSEVQLRAEGALQDEVLVAWPGDRSRPGDDDATRALVYLLGETGYAGRLGRALVDPGLVYSVSASLEGRGAGSFLAVRTAADPHDTADVLRRIRGVLEEAARGGFTEAERREALAYLQGRAALARDGSPGSAEALLGELVAPDQGSWSGLTLAALDHAARRLFARGYPVAIVAGAGAPGR
jgi:predicted Zn-dependent peptidase